MSEIQKKWYVLRAISGKEHKVKEYIDYEIAHTNLSDFVSQVLIPTEKTVTVRNGKKVVKERSYLPGYVLVEVAWSAKLHIISAMFPMCWDSSEDWTTQRHSDYLK